MDDDDGLLPGSLLARVHHLAQGGYSAEHEGNYPHPSSFNDKKGTMAICPKIIITMMMIMMTKIKIC